MLMEQTVRVLEPPQPICVSGDTPLREVIDTLILRKIGCVLVTEGPELVGVFTERDVLMNIAGREAEVGGDMVREWMTANPETIEEDDSVAFAIHKMDVGGYRHLPVTEAGRPTGVVSIRDVVRYLANALASSAP
jgi:CBS domain-containing protein